MKGYCISFAMPIVNMNLNIFLNSIEKLTNVPLAWDILHGAILKKKAFIYLHVDFFCIHTAASVKVCSVKWHSMVFSNIFQDKFQLFERYPTLTVFCTHCQLTSCLIFGMPNRLETRHQTWDISAIEFCGQLVYLRRWKRNILLIAVTTFVITILKEVRLYSE